MRYLIKYIKYNVCLFVYYLNNIRFNFVSERDKELIINVQSINYFIEDLNFRKLSFPGLIFGGNFWLNKRLKTHVLDGSAKYQGIRQHFVDGVDWIDTDLFTIRYKKKLKEKGTVKGCTTLFCLAEKYKMYDDIYQDIKINGVRSSNEYPNIDPIYIYIDADGSLIYTSNGNHRLYICLILGVDKMPVKVWARHTKWQKKRDELATLGKIEFFSKYPSLSSHPDLLDFFN